MPRSDTAPEDDGANFIQILEDERSVKSRSPKPIAPPGGYIKLHFQQDEAKPKLKQTNGTVIVEEAKPRDVGRTKFDYSTIVFGAEREKEKDLELAGKLKKDKAPPPPVEKYSPRKKMNKYKSETHVLNGPEMKGASLQSASHQMPPSKPTSLPDLLETTKTLDYAEVDFSSPPPPPLQHARPKVRQNYTNVINSPSDDVKEEQPYVNVPPR